MSTSGRLRYLEAAAQNVSAAARGRIPGTLVLLHAFPMNARMWDAQLSLAAQGWRVIAPQFRGFDTASSAEQPVTSMDDYAGDLVDLLDTLHIDDAVIGGLSMGGYVAFALFRHAPQYVRGLILADTKSQADTPEAKQGRQKMLMLAQEKGASAIADEMLPKLLGETTRRERPTVVEQAKAMIWSNSAEALSGGLRAMMTRPDSTPLLGTIHVPTLILVGQEDTVTPPELSHEMHHAIAGSQLVTIPNAGHLSNLEQPVVFNAAVAQFLEHRV